MTTLVISGRSLDLDQGGKSASRPRRKGMENGNEERKGRRGAEKDLKEGERREEGPDERRKRWRENKG